MGAARVGIDALTFGHRRWCFVPAVNGGAVPWQVEVLVVLGNRWSCGGTRDPSYGTEMPYRPPRYRVTRMRSLAVNTRL